MVTSMGGASIGLAGTITRRLGYGLLLLFAVLVLNFILISAAPGDIADTIAGIMGGADVEVLAEIRAGYGLDQPFHIQLWRYMTRVAVLDLGYSHYFDIPVTPLLLEKLPPTLLLVFSAQFLAIAVGTVLGVLAAQRPRGALSLSVTFFALIGFAAPISWTGILMIIMFVSIFPLFPVGGLLDVAFVGGGWAMLVDLLHHLLLPMVTLASVFIAMYSRLARAAMLEVLGSDYVRTARAKGVPERRVLYKHALRNALGPVVTVAGLQFSAVVSGAVVVETIFSWPGLGTLAFQSILARDIPTLMGILFFSSVVVVVFNLITDMILRLLDPRIRTA